MRIVRDAGELSDLFGDFELRDLPYSLFEAVHQGLFFLGFDEWDAEDRPPKHIWLDAEKLNAHISAVRNKRSNPDKEIEGPTERNALIDELVVE